MSTSLMLDFVVRITGFIGTVLCRLLTASQLTKFGRETNLYSVFWSR